MKSQRLFVGNIPPGCTEQDIRQEFGAYGRVQDVELKEKNNSIFGFVNLEIDDQTLQQCIQEFKNEQYKGVYLTVSKAKESFLERLKREREEAEHRKSSRKNEQSSSNQRETLRVAELPKFQTTVSESSSSESEDEPPAAPPPPKKVLPLPNLEWNFSKTIEEKPLNKAQMSENKRLQGLEKIKSAYEQQRHLIQSALSDPDAMRARKIRFEDAEADDVAGPMDKMNLFDEDNEADDFEADFEVKKQFQGKKGEDLFNLQARYKHDSRFIMDEKFKDADDDEMNVDQPRKKSKSNETEKQLEILGQITKKPLPEKSKMQQKSMIRFDPSKQEHEKYMKGGKKASNEQSQEPPQEEFKVSDEQFVKINADLKGAIGQGTSGFSLLSMLGREEHVADDESSEDEAEQETTFLPPVFKGKQFKYDSSEDEAEETHEPKEKKIKLETSTQSTKKAKKDFSYKPFFIFDDDDPRLIEGRKFFTEPPSFVPQEELEKTRKNINRIVKQKIKKSKQKVKAGDVRYLRKQRMGKGKWRSKGKFF